MRLRDGGWRGPLIALGLLLLVWAVYGQVRHFEFVNFDDNLYITGNFHTRAGLSWRGAAWAFTTGSASNWHPITWLSYLTDISLFGLSPGAFHLTSLAFHAADALLLFGLLRSLTREVWPSALVAVLFAVHPLHVESVAWVSERKDVLSLFFGLLCLWAYAANARRPSRGLRAAVLATLVLGLMSKPMLVSLPLVMLLLDFWPLGRMEGWPAFLRLCREKVPCALLALGSCLVTVVVQRLGGSMITLERIPFPLRLGNALVACCRYLVQAVWPFHLSPFYPFMPDEVHLGSSLACLGLLAAVTVLAIRARKAAPYLLVGWLWYLVTLLPVVGLVQVGAQAMADRYTYLPLTGPFLALAWGARDLARGRRLRTWVLGGAAVAAVGLLSLRAHNQASYWRTSVTLWRHALRVSPVNQLSLTNLGGGYYVHGANAEAAEMYRASLALQPRSWVAWKGLGMALEAMGELDRAVDAYRESQTLHPEDFWCNQHLLSLLLGAGRFQEALPYLASYVRMEPLRLAAAQDPRAEAWATQNARMKAGMIQRRLGRDEEAIPWFAQAFQAHPRDLNAGFNLALSLEATGRLEEAEGVLDRCVELDPSNPLPYLRVGEVRARRGRGPQAAEAFRKVLALRPGDPEALKGLRALTPRS